MTITPLDHDPDIARTGVPTAANIGVAFGIGGVLGLLVLGFVAGTRYGDALALVIWLALVVSTVACGWDIWPWRRSRSDPPPSPAGEAAEPRTTAVDGPVRRSVADYGGLLAVTLITAVASQTWFLGGGGVAGGDLSPPDGTGWISHVFSSWVWTGSNLGSPGILQEELPWAAVLGSVHVLGGSADTAERIWCTLAFVGAGLCSYGLLRVAGLGRTGSVIGALCYCFNPFVLTSVGPNPLYLVALAMIPLVALVVVATARERLRPLTGALLIAATAPLLGYTFLTPPLTVMVVGTIVLSVIAVFLVWGSTAGRRAVRCLAIGLPLLVILSCYWIVPAFLSLGGAATGQLGATSSWTWTESRSGLANAFWLNTTWAWSNPRYFPFAARYGTFPLSVIRYIVPAAAFAALPLGSRVTTSKDTRRITVVVSAAVLFFVFLATGTLWPGKVIFDPLYQLPLGWLLREPGRLLLLAGLGCAVLVGITIDGSRRALAQWGTALRGTQIGARALSPAFGRWALAAVLVVVVFVTNEPLAVGSVVVPAGNVNTVATTHVTVPAYWTSMAAALNRSDTKGNLVVLPPDDFYQMPYKWGYYGSDGFILDMIDRNVLDPTSQGYWPGQQQVISAVDTIATAALTRNWYLLDQLMTALGSPYILLRGDIDASYPGRTIISPVELDAALERDPDLVVARRDGPLVLFARKEPIRSPVGFATVVGSTPDLTDLSLLPPGTALVTGPQIPGVPEVIESDPLRWAISANTASVVVPEHPGWTYATRTIDGTSAVGVPVEPPSSGDAVNSSVIHTPHGTSLDVTFPVTTNLLPDGNFDQGLWEPHVGDCDAANPTLAAPELDATVLHHRGPGGSNVLKLVAGVDTACESQKFALTTGTPLLSIRTRNLSGTGPRLCLYAVGPNTCIPLPPVPDTSTWNTYVATATPPAGTTGLALFLYADGPGGGSTSVDEYADVTVHNFSVNPIVLATPTPKTRNRQRVRLVAADSSYSSTWNGPAGSRHVLVDGMTNGWLVPPGAPAAQSPGYRGTKMVAGAAVISGVAVILLLSFVCLILIIDRTRRHRRSGVPG